MRVKIVAAMLELLNSKYITPNIGPCLMVDLPPTEAVASFCRFAKSVENKPIGDHLLNCFIKAIHDSHPNVAIDYEAYKGEEFLRITVKHDGYTERYFINHNGIPSLELKPQIKCKSENRQS